VRRARAPRGAAARPHPPARPPAHPSACRCCPGAPATRGSPRHPVSFASQFAQDPNREPGDVAGDLPWVRYSDPKVKEFKLNAERNNGRAAMMGIVGMVIHESLTGNPLFPLNAPVA